LCFIHRGIAPLITPWVITAATRYNEGAVGA